MAGHSQRATLVVDREAKIADLLGAAGAGVTRLEASGVLAHRDVLWVIFDNSSNVVRLHLDLRSEDADPWVHSPTMAGGYEDLTVDSQTGDLFLLVESDRAPSGALLAQVHAVDRDFGDLGSCWLDAPLKRANKGVEGLTCVRRDGRRFLLGLPEGNAGRAGRQGQRPGRGRVHVFTEDPAVPRSPAVAGGPSWGLLTTIHLPASLPFTDFSGISHLKSRLAVVSQECSQLWVGRLDPASWQIVDEGQVYDFPRTKRGKIRYGTIEGVSWLTERQLAVVSDKAKKSQPLGVRAKDQSVHVVSLPEGP